MKKLIDVAKQYNDGLITALEAKNKLIMILFREDFSDESVNELCTLLADNE